MKKFLKDNCGYSIEILGETVPNIEASVYSILIGKYFCKSIYILRAYIDCITYGTEEFVNTVYKSHRRVHSSAD